MKRFLSVLVLTFIIIGVNAQNLKFEELSSIPEFELFTVYDFDRSECSIITSGVSQIIAVSFDKNEYLVFDNFSDGKPVLFQEIAEDLILGYNLTTLYAISRSGLVELDLSLENDEIIGAIFPAENNQSFFLSTTLGFYRSTDSGNSFALEFEWAEPTQSSLPITVSIWTYSIKHLKTTNAYYFEVRDEAGNLLQEYPLSFFPRSMVIYDNFAYLTGFGENSIYTLDLVSGDVINHEFPSLGNKNNLFLFENEVLNYSMDNLELYKFQSNSLLSISDLNFFKNGTYSGLQGHNFLLHSSLEIYIPLSLTPLRFDTIRPDVTATRVTDIHMCDDVLHAMTDENYYVLEDDGWQDYWRGGTGFEIDAHCNSYLSGGPDFLTKFNHQDLSYDTFDITIPISTKWVNFGDTTLITGRQFCQELIPGDTHGAISADGGETWSRDILAPPCFEQLFTTITDDRVYIYDRDQSYALAPGNAVYAWFGYYDRKAGQVVMIEPDPSLPFVPESSGQLAGEQVYFYVSPDETFYMNPVNALNDIGYHSTDFGETWTATPGVPSGRIYPTPDSLGTLVVNVNRFYVRYDVTQPYVELEVTPTNLPPVDWLFYNSQGQMIIGNQSGFFHVTDGITTAVEEVRKEQLAGVRIWPNPAITSITVQHYNQPIHQVHIYDLMGEVVKTLTIKSSKELNVDVYGLAAGLYLVEAIDHNGKQFVEQLVIGGR